MIQEKIEKVSRIESYLGVHIVILYGMGGVGKTTIFKVLCNDLASIFCDSVCHIELKM